MKRPVNAALAALLAAGLAWGGGSVAQAQEIDVGGGGDNTAIVVNTKDGSAKFRVSFRIVRTNADTVDNDNAAVAVASCTDCRTVAVAMQVVLVFSEPSTLTTDNLAIALNIECSGCETLASAYQWVLGTDGQVHLSPEGNRIIAEIRQALHDLVRSDLPLDELQAQLDQLAEQLEQVLANELVAAAPPGVTVDQVEAGDGLEGLDGGGATDGQEPGGSEPTPQTWESPAGSETPEGSGGTTGTTEVSPSPTESPVGTPTPTPVPSVSPTA